MKLLSPANAGQDVHLLDALIRIGADSIALGIVRFAGEMPKMKEVVVTMDKDTPDEKSWNDLVVDLQPLELRHFVAAAKLPVFLLEFEDGEEIPSEVLEVLAPKPVAISVAGSPPVITVSAAESIGEPLEVDGTKTVVDADSLEATPQSTSKRAKPKG